jgi:hypothetical protein
MSPWPSPSTSRPRHPRGNDCRTPLILGAVQGTLERTLEQTPLYFGAGEHERSAGCPDQEAPTGRSRMTTSAPAFCCALVPGGKTLNLAAATSPGALAQRKVTLPRSGS